MIFHVLHFPHRLSREPACHGLVWTLSAAAGTAVSPPDPGRRFPVSPASGRGQGARRAPIRHCRRPPADPGTFPTPGPALGPFSATGAARPAFHLLDRGRGPVAGRLPRPGIPGVRLFPRRPPSETPGLRRRFHRLVGAEPGPHPPDGCRRAFPTRPGGAEIRRVVLRDSCRRPGSRGTTFSISSRAGSNGWRAGSPIGSEKGTAGFC